MTQESSTKITRFIAANGEPVTKIVTPEITGFVADSVPHHILDAWKAQLDRKIAARKARLAEKHGRNTPQNAPERPSSDLKRDA